LLKIQGERCAYCERRTLTDRNDGHIEHFRGQADHPNLDMEWANMFWACIDENTCGKHKDKCSSVSGPKKKYDPQHLLNPCVDDPDMFLLFVSDGTIKPRTDLDPAQKQRAEETLRVFCLTDSPLLRKSREDAIHPYIGALDALKKAGPKYLKEYMQSEIKNLDEVPFATAIRHFFRDYVA